MSNDKEQLASVFATGAERRVPLAYVVVTCAIGAVALVSGVIAMAWANEAMVATLVVATVVLWVLATARHAITPAPAARGSAVGATRDAIPMGRP